MLRKVFRFLPRNPVGRAFGAFHRGDFETAAALFDDVLQDEPHPAADVVRAAGETWASIGRARDAAGDLQGALTALERAVVLVPRHADVLVVLARLHERLDQPQRARETYERALELNPRYFEARLSLARLLIHLEDRPAALRELEEAARTGPAEAAPALQEIVDGLPALNLASRDGRARLEPLFAALLSRSPSPVAAGLETALAALRDGDNARAIAELKRLLETHPHFPDLHNLLGVAYDNEEMTDDAIEEFETALRLNPRYVDARLHLGIALYERGRDVEAQRHLRQIAASSAGHEVARSMLARIEARSAAS